jgi:hypothetical protein
VIQTPLPDPDDDDDRPISGMTLERPGEMQDLQGEVAIHGVQGHGAARFSALRENALVSRVNSSGGRFLERSGTDEREYTDL